ncbi:hypothetical protein HanRHA438_Chr02g0083161 [Helianthus annuus]|nr:hypothetical protein HanRHA438_Chr02g0083161 [Helianthus annuus]
MLSRPEITPNLYPLPPLPRTTTTLHRLLPLSSAATHHQPRQRSVKQVDHINTFNLFVEWRNQLTLS